jgi:hypothetical protein
MELASLEEDHVNSLSRSSAEHLSALTALQSKLHAADEARQLLEQQLVDASEEARRAEVEHRKQREGSVVETDLKALHVAHQAKMGEVEREWREKVAQLNEVRFSS